MTMNGESLTIIVMRDITMKKQAMEELELTLSGRARARENDSLGRAIAGRARNAAMGELLGTVTNHWGKPLTSLGKIVAGIGQVTELKERGFGKAIEDAASIIDGMTQTISSYQNFFEPSQAPSSYRLGDTLQRAALFMEASARSKWVGISIDCLGDIAMRGYPNELAQVLLNIVSNSLDAFGEDVGEGECDRHIKIRAWLEPGMAHITIRDNAGGIDESSISKMFEPFYTTKSGGTGVGLPMSKIMIERHMGGKLSARNHEGGAEFRIELPAP
jgi:signal transduction histidine kinase